MLTVAEIKPENAAPVASMTLTQAGEALRLDATSSADPDGEIVAYEWYVDLTDSEVVATGRTTTVTVPAGRPLLVTLALPDNDGKSTFKTRNVAPLQVDPELITLGRWA